MDVDKVRAGIESAARTMKEQERNAAANRQKEMYLQMRRRLQGDMPDGQVDLGALTDILLEMQSGITRADRLASRNMVIGGR